MVIIKNKGGLGLSPNSVKIVRRLLIAGFNYAINAKLIPENPVSKTKIPPVIESKATSLTIEEAKAFVSVKDHFWYGNAFVFQLHTGLRPQELMALIWQDINFEQGTVRIERACKWIGSTFINFGPTKTKRSNRIIELAPEHLGLLHLHFNNQQKIIEQCKKESSLYGEKRIKQWVLEERPKQQHLYNGAKLIFPRPDGSAPCITHPRRQFKAMLEYARISNHSNIRWYDLRHTHASILLAMGIPPHEIAERMGHTVNMLMTTYAHMLSNRRREAPTMFVTHVPV
jgi:integrase